MILYAQKKTTNEYSYFLRDKICYGPNINTNTNYYLIPYEFQRYGSTRADVCAAYDIIRVQSHLEKNSETGGNTKSSIVNVW